MDGGVWQKTMKGHVYTYMQGEEDYEKNTNLTSHQSYAEIRWHVVMFASRICHAVDHV